MTPDPACAVDALVPPDSSVASGRRASTDQAREWHRVGEPGFRRVAVALFTAGVATFALLYATQPLLTVLARQFHRSAGQAALSVSAATITLGIAMLVAGPISEVRGRTPLMFASLFASSVVGLACAAAPDWPVLLVLRCIQGAALAGLPAVAMAYLREEVHPDAHARATGLYVAGTALGGMIGRLLAGGVADLAGWRAAVAAVAGLGLLCALVTRALLPPSRHFTRGSARPGTIVRLSLRLLADPVLLVLYGIAATLMGAFVAVYNALGFRLAAAPYHLSVAAAGLVFLVYPVGSLSSALAGRATERLGRAVVTCGGVVLMAAGILATLLSPLALVVAGVAVLTGGFFTAHGVASGWVAARAQRTIGGTAQAAGWYLFFYYLGSSIAGGLAGAAWSAGGWEQVTELTLALTAGGGVLSLLLVALTRRGARG